MEFKSRIRRIRSSSKYFNTKRISFDLLALFFILLLVYFIPMSYVPIEAKTGFMSLLFSKMTFISCGVIHAHIIRKLLFPYIDFHLETDVVRKVAIVVIYAVVIWGWARGG